MAKYVINMDTKQEYPFYSCIDVVYEDLRHHVIEIELLGTREFKCDTNSMFRIVEFHLECEHDTEMRQIYDLDVFARLYRDFDGFDNTMQFIIMDNLAAIEWQEKRRWVQKDCLKRTLARNKLTWGR